MNHEPFENWIFEEKLTSEQSKQLKEHLEECEHCRELQQSWDSLHQQIKAVPMASPAPGFSSRWLGSLEQRRIKEQTDQVKKFILILVISALFSLLFFSISLMMDRSPIDWMINALQTTAQVSIRLRQIQRVLFSISNSLPSTIQVAAWILFTLPLGLLSLTWVGAIWRISTQGVSEK